MFSKATKKAVRPWIPAPIEPLISKAFELQRELPLVRLKYRPNSRFSFRERGELVHRLRFATNGIDCKHTHAEMDAILSAIFSTPSTVHGCIVEAGCFKGGSTAKLSIAAKLIGRKLRVFDSFAGLPPNEEKHRKTIFGQTIKFTEGHYRGALEEVRDNVQRYGEIDACEFVQGWFEDTMPQFHEPVVAAFIDVDLASSTQTCLRYLYPLLVPGGAIFSHDGHVPLCIDVFRDDRFWRDVVGFERPAIPGLGRQKLLKITKPL